MDTKSTYNRTSSAPPGQAALHNLIVASSSKRKNHSDSDFLSQKRRRSIVTASGTNQNSTFFSPDAEAHHTVHTLVPAIVQRCQQVSSLQQQEQTSLFEVRPPEEECYLLAYWALVDNYNKAVICSMGGVEAVVRAMQTFPNSTGLQECGCLVLGNLCKNGPCQAIERAGGVESILRAAQRHPSSVAVQSAVCEALQNILNFEKATNNKETATATELETDLLSVLSHASSMYLSNNKHKTAELLLAKTLLRSDNYSPSRTADKC